MNQLVLHWSLQNTNKWFNKLINVMSYCNSTILLLRLLSALIRWDEAVNSWNIIDWITFKIVQFIVYVIDFIWIPTFGGFNLRFSAPNTCSISHVKVIPVAFMVYCDYSALWDIWFVPIAPRLLYQKWTIDVTKHGFSKNLLCNRISQLTADHMTHTNVYEITQHATPHSIIEHLNCTSRGKTRSG